MLERIEEHYTRDFDQRLCKARDRIRTDDYVFIGKLDGVTKIPNLGHGVKSPCGAMGLDQKTVFIQRMELVKRIPADRIALVYRPSGVSLTPAESSLAADVQDKSFKRTPCLFHGILDYFLIDDSWLEFLLN